MIIGDLEIRLRADIARLARDMDDARRVVGDAVNAMGRAADIAKAAFAGIAGALSLAKVTGIADEYTKLTAQLRLATDGTRAFNQAYGDVKRIANSSQTDLAATGSLYASLSRATKDLGTSQSAVADITESVSLALKISGSGAQESAGAILQLSQAFAAGALRGDEFNSVAESAPRLMKAIADNIGVPVGALRAMAEQGKLTTDLVGKSLVQALQQLRSEGQQIQTISGATQVLNNNMLEFVGTQAQASGAVAVLTRGIGLLANNLGLLAGAAIAGGIVKLGATLGSWTSKTYEAVTATIAARAATIAGAEAAVVDTAAKAAQITATQAMIVVAREEAVAKLASSNANIAAAEVAIAAAEAAGAQSFALRTVRLATAELSVAEAQRSAMLAELAVLGRQQTAVSAQLTEALAAQAAAQAALNGATGVGGAAAGAASRAVGALGGPIGIVITLLGLAATAWVTWGNSAETSTKQVAETYDEAHKRIVKNLDEQIAKNEKLIQLQNLGLTKPEINRNQSTLDQLGAASKRLNDINNLTGDYAPGRGKDSSDVILDRAKVMADIVVLTEKLKKADDLAAKAAAGDTEALIAVRERLTGVNQQYLDDLTKLKAALDKGAISQADYVDAVSKLAKDTYEGSTAGKLYSQSLDAQAEAIQRAAEAQGLRNQRDQEHIQFLRATGQKDEESTIRAAAAAQIKYLNDQIATQQRLLGIDNQRQETAEQHAQKQAEIRGKISNLRLQIDNAQKKRDEDLFKLEQDKYRLAVNNYGDLLEAAQKETKAQQDVVRDGQDEIDMLWMTSKQIAEVTAGRILDRAALLEWNAVVQDAIDLSGRLGDESRKQAESLREQAAQVITKEEITRQKELWSQIENTAHDTFISIFDSGKSAFDRLRDALKNGLLELLYQMTLKPWIISIGATGALSGAGGLSQSMPGVDGVGTSNPLIAATQVASSLYKAINGGLDSLSTSLANTIQAGLDKSGLSSMFDSMAPSVDLASGVTGNGAFASIGGKGVSMLGSYMLGSGLNSMISGQYKVGSGFQTVEKISTAVASYFGPVAGSIAGAVSGLINRAFGRGPTEVQSQGIRGTLSADGLTGESYQNLHQDGGWFRSDKNWSDVKAFTDDLRKQFTEGMSAIETASSGFAKSLGVSADWVTSYSKAFDIALTGDATKDQKAITDFFAGVGDEIASRLVPNLETFRKSGETAAAALERLATDFQGTDQVAQLLGKTAAQLFGADGMDSAQARENLIGAAGGLSTLSQQAQAFNQNFLTDAERIKPVAEALDKALGSLGLDTIPTTRDEFKGLINSLIDSGAAATDVGGKQLASLLALAEAFAQVHPQVDATAQAVEKAADALQAMKDSASTLLGGVDSAFSVLQTVVEREKKAVQASVNVHTAAISKLQSLSQSLRGALDSIKSPDQQVLARAVAQSQIRAVLASVKAGGALPDADSLKDALSAVSKDSTDRFATYQDYLKDLYQTQNDIAQLGDVTDDQLSVEQKALKAAQDQLDSLDEQLAKAQEQIDQLKGINTNGLTLIDAMAALTSAVLAANSNPIVSATSAINGAYQSALHRAPDAAGLEWWQNAAANGAPVSQIVDGIKGSTEATLNTLYRDVLGRAPDAEGLAFWMKAYGSEMSEAEKADWLKAAQKDPGYKIPGYAAGGDFGGGWRIVGESGPELEATGPARIFSAGQTSDLFSRLSSPSGNNDALLAEVKALRMEVQAFRIANSAENTSIAKSSAKSADALDGAVNGGRPLLTAT